MPSDKDRLYVALYARGGAPKMPGLEDTYHWALLVGPKTEDKDSRGARHHAKEKMQFVGTPAVRVSVWEYENIESTMLPTSALLIRVIIGKIKDRNLLESLLGNIPVRPDVEGWNCVSWVKEALETVLQNKRAMATTPKNTDWKAIRDTAMWYIGEKKAAHRFDGQASFDMSKTATWDMIDGFEQTP